MTVKEYLHTSISTNNKLTLDTKQFLIRQKMNTIWQLLHSDSKWLSTVKSQVLQVESDHKTRLLFIYTSYVY